jgi:1-acyl-sn-glycerol-3-phosphate acyltransferase
MASTTGASRATGKGRADGKAGADGKGRAEGKGRAAARVSSGRGAVAAGAARASGERARRRSTPLIASVEPAAAAASTPAASTPAASAPAASTAVPATPGPTKAPDLTQPAVEATTPSSGKHRPRPVAKAVPTRTSVARSGARTTRPGRPGRPRQEATGGHNAGSRHTPSTNVRTLKAVTDETVAPRPQAAPAATSRSIAPGIEELLTAGIAAVRVAAEAAGISPDDVERHLASLLSFVRRRVTGDYTVDDFGFDEDFTRHFYLPVLHPLYRSWFRVEVRGIANIPAEGGGLVVANHSGTIAMDSLMTQVAVHDEHPAHRHLRMLGADLVFQTPVVGPVARKSGSTLAATADAERLLSSGELCGVWPEGFKGVGKPFSERYKLQRFGRGGFVAAALRTGVPIIPCSIVGAEEIYPIIGNMKTVARLFGAPYAPITPTWPLLGPLGLIPLPSKWIIEFGSPVETADLGPNAADDPMLVFDLTDQVRETIQQTLYSLLMQRRSVFF